MKKEVLYRNIIRTVAWAVSCALVSFITISNMTPWGAEVIYSSQDDGGISLVGPTNRIKIQKQGTEYIPEQISDLTYFTTNMPFDFDSAKISITYLNPYSDQMIKLGYKDKDIWHYNTTVIDSTILEKMSWSKIGTGPSLYQKNPDYKTVEDFMFKPPKGKVIGTYDYNLAYLKNFETVIPDYKPYYMDTEINTPLRGKHTMYVYLDGEKFNLEVTKQDLNWYEDPDVMSIKVYKGRDEVYQATIDDDGITDDSKTPGTEQLITIKNPGLDFPEKGVYKIVFDNSGDTVIKKIKTNLHKIIFENTISPIDNAQVYPMVTKETHETKVFTNAKQIKFQTNHDQGKQDITILNQKVALEKTHEQITVGASGEVNDISMPKSDVIVSALGFFAFSPDSLFEPSPYKVVEVSDKDDIDHIDYLVTNFTPPLNNSSGWRTAIKEFDLRDAYVDKGKLSWIIQMPGIKDRPLGILIRKIEIQFTKKGWI
jgi:hypothetical protein